MRTLDDVRADKTLNVVTTASAPPHGFKNPQSNRLEGIMVDVAAAVARHLGVADKLSDVPFSGLIPTLTSGRRRHRVRALVHHRGTRARHRFLGAGL